MQAEVSIFAQHGLRCPITAGLPTKLSAESWEKTCATMRKPRPAYHGGYPTVPHKICSLCAGKHRPEELEIIDMAQDTCGACGEKKTLSNNRGKKVCSSCAALYGAANNRPELVLQLYQSRELVYELEGKLHAVNDQYDKLNEEHDNLSDNADELREEAAAAKHALQLAEERIEALERKLSSKSNESDAALLDVALAVIREEPIPANQIAVLIQAARRTTR